AGLTLELLLKLVHHFLFGLGGCSLLQFSLQLVDDAVLIGGDVAQLNYFFTCTRINPVDGEGLYLTFSLWCEAVDAVNKTLVDILINGLIPAQKLGKTLGILQIARHCG